VTAYRQRSMKQPQQSDILLYLTTDCKQTMIITIQTYSEPVGSQVAEIRQRILLY
jgi:hypothetical protein